MRNFFLSWGVTAPSGIRASRSDSRSAAGALFNVVHRMRGEGGPPVPGLEPPPEKNRLFATFSCRSPAAHGLGRSFSCPLAGERAGAWAAAGASVVQGHRAPLRRAGPVSRGEFPPDMRFIARFSMFRRSSPERSAKPLTVPRILQRPRRPRSATGSPTGCGRSTRPRRRRARGRGAWR